MPFSRPPLSDLVTQIRSDLRGRLSIANPLLRRAMADVLGAVWGGAVHMLFGYLDWLARQLFADTADDDQVLRAAALYGITPTPATFAAGKVTCTGTSGTISAGAVLQIEDSAYVVTTGGTLSGGTATVVVTAALAGAASNLGVGATLTFQSPISGVNAAATVTTGGPAGDGIAGGVDQETVAGVLARYLLRLREPGAGGRAADYVEWVLGAAGSGATRVWPSGNEAGLGTVVVRFVDDAASPIIPTSGQVAAAQAALDANRPITAVATAVAPTSLAINFTIHLVPDTSATRAAVTAELTDLLARVAQPGNGAGLGSVLLSQIRTAIGSSDGVTDYTLTVPSSDVVPGTGQLPTVGTITWV